MRRWIARQVMPFRIWSEQRRQFLEVNDWMLERHSFWNRLWHRYLFWIGYVARGVVHVHVGLAIRRCVQLRCIIADVISGGDRQRRFIEAWRQEIAEMNKRNREIDKEWQEHVESSFALRL